MDMEQIHAWLKTNPYATVIIIGILVGVFILVHLIIKLFRWIGAYHYYQIAKEFNLKVTSEQSAQDVNVPRIVGYYKDRDMEITGYEKATPQGVMLTYIRIKMSHKAYIVRGIVMEYNSIKNPPLQKLTIEYKEYPLSNLSELEAFDPGVVNETMNFLQKYSFGEVLQNTILTFNVEFAYFDREVTLVGDARKIRDCMEDFRKLLKRMEDISLQKKSSQ